MAGILNKPNKVTVAPTATKTDLETFLSPKEVEEIPVAEDGPIATYSSHPIMKYRLGRKWKFENGTLKLTKSEEIKEFEKALEALPLPERHKIRRLDVASAERISKEYLAKQGGATQQIDSTIGERATQSKLGKVDLADPNANGGAVE